MAEWWPKSVSMFVLLPSCFLCLSPFFKISSVGKPSAQLHVSSPSKGCAKRTWGCCMTETRLPESSKKACNSMQFLNLAILVKLSEISCPWRVFVKLFFEAEEWGFEDQVRVTLHCSRTSVASSGVSSIFSSSTWQRFHRQRHPKSLADFQTHPLDINWRYLLPVNKKYSPVVSNLGLSSNSAPGTCPHLPRRNDAKNMSWLLNSHSHHQVLRQNKIYTEPVNNYPKHQELVVSAQCPL